MPFFYADSEDFEHLSSRSSGTRDKFSHCSSKTGRDPSLDPSQQHGSEGSQNTLKEDYG